MIPIHTVFGSFLILFAVIGSLRGWAKEIIVAFSVFLALFVQHVLLTFIPPIRGIFEAMATKSQFYTRTVLFILIAVFGYASPTIATRLGAKVARERLQDLLLGFFIGLLNGFLVVGTLLWFLDSAYYGISEGQWSMQQVVDEQGEPVFDEEGRPVQKVVYVPEAKGIGGIKPPEPDSTSATLIAFLPPQLIEQSDAILYLAVAASFVFVLIVFI
jgi:uncharacterized membrane protein required for colicin V production